MPWGDMTVDGSRYHLSHHIPAECNVLVGDLPLVEINISLLADQVGVSSSNTLDLGQGDHDLSSTLDVGVEETENVLLVSSEHSERDRHVAVGYSETKV